MKLFVVFVLLLSSVNSSLGDELILYPNSDALRNESTPSPAVTNYQNVDEVSPDDDTTYNYYTGYEPTHPIDIFGIQDHTTETEYIKYITVTTRAKESVRNFSPSCQVRAVIELNSTLYYGNWHEIEQVWTGSEWYYWDDYTYTFTQNPDTVTTWTWSDIDNIKSGYQINNKNTASYWTGVTQSYITVVYNNSAPPVPTNLTEIGYIPLNATPTITWNKGVDADGDTITTFVYVGDTTATTTEEGNTTLESFEIGNIFTFGSSSNVYYYRLRNWDGYNWSNYSDVIDFGLAPPDLQTPMNASTHTYPFPPLLHDLTFAWQDTNAPAYKYQVATDDDFNLITEEDIITQNTTTLSLEADDYYWRVYAYETDTGTYSNASDVWEFTINETNGDGAITAIDGVVYEITTAGSVAVDDALVNIWNNTWSDSMLVGQNGYYYFDGAKDGTYSVRATKTGYTDSSIELVTVQALNTTTRNILLQSYTGAGREYVTHYVLFTVKTLWGTLYSGVDVNVYLGDAVIALYTGTTGTDGSIGFELVESNEYQLTFIDASQGIDEEIIIYPVKSEYPVYIYDTLAPDDEDIESEEVKVTVTTAEINDTHAYINVTYIDAMNETTDLNIYINQSDESDPFNQTVITFANLGATSIVTHSFIINDYPGQAYFINVGATHTTFGDIQRTYSVRFDGMLEDYGFSKIWVWIGVGGMMFVAGMFKASKAEQGALVVCVAGWVFMAMGFFDSLGSQAVFSMKAGLGLATVLAVGANMSKKDRDETV